MSKQIEGSECDDIEKAQDRYEQDPEFANLVNMINWRMCRMEYTASEVRAAALLAALHFERSGLRSSIVK